MYLSRWVQETLFLGPRNPVQDDLQEIHFWLMRNFFYQLKNQKVTGESMCEIEAAAAKDYVKQVKQKLFERGVKKTRKYLKATIF